MLTSLQCVAQDGRCTPRYFESSLLRRVNSRFLSRDSTPSKILLDLLRLRWADLIELMSVAALGWYLSRQFECPVSLRLPESSPHPLMAKALAGSGFPDLAARLGLQTLNTLNEGVDTYSFFRFTNVSDIPSKEKARNRLLGKLEFHYPWMKPSQLLSFDKILNEVLENLLEHAYSRPASNAPRIVAVRRFNAHFLFQSSETEASRLSEVTYWLRELIRATNAADFLEIGMVDVGLGIRQTIAAALEAHVRATLTRDPIPAELDDLSALKFVLSPHRSSSVEGKERGFGLYKFKNHVQAWSGTFIIRSGRASILYNPATQKDEYRRHLRFFPGTQIRVLLPIHDRAKNIAFILRREASLR